MSTIKAETSVTSLVTETINSSGIVTKREYKDPRTRLLHREHGPAVMMYHPVSGAYEEGVRYLHGNQIGAVPSLFSTAETEAASQRRVDELSKQIRQNANDSATGLIASNATTHQLVARRPGWLAEAAKARHTKAHTPRPNR